MEEIETILAPGGRFAVRVSAWEARNSQWVYVPSLIEAGTGAIVFAFADRRWSMDQATWRSETVVHLVLRKFPGDHRPAALEVVVDCADRTAVLGSGGTCAVGEVEEALEGAFEKRPSGD